MDRSPKTSRSAKPRPKNRCATLHSPRYANRKRSYGRQATADVDGSRFDAAKRDLQKILALGDGGVRKDDARKYLDEVIPRRQQEENLFRQAKQAAQSSDPKTLQKAVDLSGQVVALNGPRRPEAEQLETATQARLQQLQQDAHKQQIAGLESGARQDLEARRSQRCPPKSRSDQECRRRRVRAFSRISTKLRRIKPVSRRQRTSSNKLSPATKRQAELTRAAWRNPAQRSMPSLIRAARTQVTRGNTPASISSKLDSAQPASSGRRSAKAGSRCDQSRRYRRHPHARGAILSPGV